ncbi:hypothetical protein ACOZ38_44150 [Sphaerisporangium viridialbum]|uniref:hypothetical protein n=1 Tax=Sphaerisporangium viridialbum TaxID=46189 RepID=UPI003C72CB4C
MRKWLRLSKTVTRDFPSTSTPEEIKCVDRALDDRGMTFLIDEIRPREQIAGEQVNAADMRIHGSS